MRHQTQIQPPYPKVLRLAVGLLCCLCACTTSLRDHQSDWNRIYGYPLEEVWTAAENAADSAGFKVVEADEERGRMRLISGTDTIELHFDSSPGLVRVDAFVANTGQSGPPRIRQVGPVLESILDEISRILREGAE